MKKLSLFFAILICGSFYAVGVKANTPQPKDYYVGTWDLMTTGLPQGSAKSTIVLERKNGKLTGYMIDDHGQKTGFYRVDEKTKSVTVYFNSSSYNVYIFLRRIDANHMAGSTMDMFDTSATRAGTKEKTKQ